MFGCEVVVSQASTAVLRRNAVLDYCGSTEPLPRTQILVASEKNGGLTTLAIQTLFLAKLFMQSEIRFSVKLAVGPKKAHLVCSACYKGMW